ncbi:MAG: hypothetical protein ACLPVY_15445 [Acidimicrobiia bacterium]
MRSRATVDGCAVMVGGDDSKQVHDQERDSHERDGVTARDEERACEDELIASICQRTTRVEYEGDADIRTTTHATFGHRVDAVQAQ